MTKVYKLKSGSKDKLLLWGAALMGDLKKEALEALREEGLSHEIMALFQIGDDWYFAGYAEGEAKPANMGRELNRKHKELLKECIEGPIETITAYDLKL